MNVLEMFDLIGQIAVVSGGAGRYGYQIVSALAEAGATVYVASGNRQNNLAKLSGLIEQGYKINVMEFDLEDESSILKLCDDIYAIEGKVDILVNNAVFRCMNGYTDTAENFDRSMHANATGLFVISRSFCDRMAKAGSGSVITANKTRQ